MEVWSKLGHDLFEPKLEMIGDMCIKEDLSKGKSIQKYIQHYPVTELSSNPPQRFAALFSVKTLWTNDDITPFLIDLAPTPKERDGLLLKFTRRHKTSNNQILYGSRIK
jgi:sister chromatid cohesion protein DCC1